MPYHFERGGHPDHFEYRRGGPLQSSQSTLAGKASVSPNGPKARRVNDACAALGIGRTTIYKLRADGKIKFVKVFGRTLVPEGEIDRLSNEGA
jgi:excisionase family DNA binding protein